MFRMLCGQVRGMPLPCMCMPSVAWNAVAVVRARPVEISALWHFSPITSTATQAGTAGSAGKPVSAVLVELLVDCRLERWEICCCSMVQRWHVASCYATAACMSQVAALSLKPEVTATYEIATGQLNQTAVGVLIISDVPGNARVRKPHTLHSLLWYGIDCNSAALHTAAPLSRGDTWGRL